MKNGKRILKVSVKRMVDDSPDTSYLGEYSATRKSDFSIDRKHSPDCAIAQPANESASQTLRNARAQVVDYQKLEDSGSDEWEALEEAYNLLDHLADDVPDCDCGERGDMERGQYRYFNPSFNYVDKAGKPTDTPENVRKYTLQDYERMEDYNNQGWYYLGIRAEATIGIGDVANYPARYNVTTQKISSGGLWGIESDSDKAHFVEIEQEQLSELKGQLLALGFSKRAIATAFKNVEKESE